MRFAFVPLILVLFAFSAGCSTSNEVTLPENATDEAPDVGFSTGGEESDEEDKGPGEAQQLRPRR